jgi:hypothetical protein
MLKLGNNNGDGDVVREMHISWLGLYGLMLKLNYIRWKRL